MNYILLTLLTFSTLIFTTGCSVVPKYRVTIDAITAQNFILTPNTYKIKALDNNKNSAGLHFQKYSAKLAHILEKTEYKVTQKGQVPQHNIYFDYGLEKVDEQTRTYAQPHMSMHMGWGQPFGWGRWGQPFGWGRWGQPFGWGHQFSQLGYTFHTDTDIYYNRYVTLLAIDQFNKELWRVDVSSVGESKNLRKIIPLLIEATAPYIGTNLAEPIHLVIKDKSTNN